MAEDKTILVDGINYENLCPVMFSTGQDYESTRTKSKKIAHFINNTTITAGLNSIDISGSEPDTHVAEMMAAMEDIRTSHFPVIINLISAGRNGKDTFANLVAEELPYHAEVVSCIGPAVEACNVFADQLYSLYQGVTPEAHIPVFTSAQLAIAKNDAYRQMLHDVKAAFTAFNNGPVLHAIGHYLRMTDTSMQHAKSSTGTLKDRCIAVFVNNRDLDTVETLQEWCYQMGIMWFNVYVKGTHNPSEYHNTCDSNVDEIPYDILIDNTGTIEELRHRASIFAKLLTWAIRLYGTPIGEGAAISGCILRGYNVYCQRVTKAQVDKLKKQPY